MSVDANLVHLARHTLSYAASHLRALARQEHAAGQGLRAQQIREVGTAVLAAQAGLMALYGTEDGAVTRAASERSLTEEVR